MNTILKPKDQNGVIALLKENDLPFEDLNFKKHKFRLKMESDEVIAVCAIEEYGKYGLLRSFSVRKDLQGKGIGKSLYEEVLCSCRNEGINALFLMTTTASGFFEKLGWSEIWRQAVPGDVRQSEEFKSLCPQSAVCMMLSLGNKDADKAVETFKSGLNCAQSVLSVFAGRFQIPEQLALKMTTSLGAGIGNKGSVCGAVLAAYMILGLKYGREKVDDLQAKENTNLKIRQFDELFLKHHNSVYCRGLLKGDVSIDKERNEIVEKGLFKKACPVFVFTASEIVQNLIEQP
ncbi:arsenic resistance N-acetyltransferase ArsN2 [Marinilabilia sp.]|uniref:arsenic resistance N-acetyltransferase ArsN2 n=1 Tax=Marinilabilia sp. TaxID=2021252 RepID=UPI0025C0249E|nr:arsenic resistance N-acetyltransferase ArsN2 [Marinilabilia sp.]